MHNLDGITVTLEALARLNLDDKFALEMLWRACDDIFGDLYKTAEALDVVAMLYTEDNQSGAKRPGKEGAVC